MNYDAFFLDAISQLGLERNQGVMGAGNGRPWGSLPAMFRTRPGSPQLQNSCPIV